MMQNSEGVNDMKLSNQQALVLFEIAKWATQVQGGVSGFSHDTILNLVNEIINQQDTTLKELG